MYLAGYIKNKLVVVSSPDDAYSLSTQTVFSASGPITMQAYLPDEPISTYSGSLLGAGVNERYLKRKVYEFTDHLGNVRAVVSDAKNVTIATGGTPIDFTPIMEAGNNYYPFGMNMPGRNFTGDGYRYGFQGQEKDDEIKGAGNSVNYKYRMHDPRLGRFFAVDPLSSKYPFYSPYTFSGNDVIRSVELEGLEPVPADEIWKLSNLTTASIGAGDISYELGNKFAKIHGQTVVLVSIKSGPNEGNFAGYTLNEGTNLKDFYDLFVQGKQIEGFDATLAYVVGGEKAPANKIGGDLGAIATASAGLASLSSKFEYSPSLSGQLGVNEMNSVGQGHFSSSTGEWVSTFSVGESLKEIGSNWLQNVFNPLNYGPSHFSIRGKGSPSGWNSFQSDFSGTYLGSGNRANAASGYLRSNPGSQAPLDVPIPEPASTEETQER